MTLAALPSLVPGEALAALRSFIPGETPVLQLLLFGWIGVALGRFTIDAELSPAPRAAQTAARREAGAKEERVDRILRQIGKVLQTHLTDSESFSERLDGANARLSQQYSVGPVKDIVMALIDDNRDMRDNFAMSETNLRSRASRSCNCKRTSSGLRRPVCATS